MIGQFRGLAHWIPCTKKPRYSHQNYVHKSIISKFMHISLASDVYFLKCENRAFVVCRGRHIFGEKLKLSFF